MSNDPSRSTRKYPCERCPLHRQKSFRNFSDEELDFVSSFKRGELVVDKGATVLCEGTKTPHLYTVLEGWGFRYKLLQDGRRQIVNYVMPGDLIGLQGTLMDEMHHSIEALSPMTLCVFERTRLMSLYRQHPELAYDVTWLASREECMLDENLLSIGRRSALERLAYLVAFLVGRARTSGLVPEKATFTMAITQQHIADTLGLSVVHTNKTVRKLADRKLLRWRDGGCEVLDEEGLAKLAGWENEEERQRPFL
ncbi:MAG: Crp/Fnr family transcriptional regulator [Aquamicrobium sp.]|uniref:Crp/Fnr family transcriptional regulator n=1 Tax=Aquamicrobium sp. TaxID=1872579 RepID=UPI00349E7AF1|nr:Crp/Fnr family transcriptional regulator [Aquamicrobium sp.]